jgi:hypothetical protein
MRQHSERRGQFLSREFLCRSPYFDGLRHSDSKVFRLRDKTPRSHFVCFRRVNQVEAKDVFVRACAYMKTVAVIRRVHDQPAILKHSPIFGSVACAKISNGRPKNRGADECNSGELQTNPIARDQTGTSNWLINLNVS